MTVQEAWNRGNNLLATAIAVLAGIAFLPEAFIEDHPIYKIDDSLLFVVGLVALGWYFSGQNKFKRSIIPMIIVTVSLAVKIMGFVIEMKNADDVGDDIGGLILFILATFVVWYLYKVAPNILKKLTK